MPAAQLAVLEADRVVYVKQTVVEGQIVYTLHTVDGTQIGVAPDRDLAFAALRQQDFEPVSVN